MSMTYLSNSNHHNQIIQQTASSTTATITRNATNSAEEQKSLELDWDLKLSALLQDLQKSVLPVSHLPGRKMNDTNVNTKPVSSSEYLHREYRSTNSQTQTQRIGTGICTSVGIGIENEPPTKAHEKYVEYGTISNVNINHHHPTPFYLTPPNSRLQFQENVLNRSRNTNVKRYPQLIRNDGHGQSERSRNERRETTRGYDDDGHYETANESPQMQFIDASNSVTILKSTESSPVPPPENPDYQNLEMVSLGIEQKEFYSNNISSPSQKNIIKRQMPPSNYVIANPISSTQAIYYRRASTPTDPQPQPLPFEFPTSPSLPNTNYGRQNGGPYTTTTSVAESENNYQVKSKYAPYPIQIGEPMYSSTPKSLNQNGSHRIPPVTLQPASPPNDRKVIHRNESYRTSCRNRNFDETSGDMCNYNYHDNRMYQSTPTPHSKWPKTFESFPTTKPPENVENPQQKFYTATITRTETRETVAEPRTGSDPVVRIFPTVHRESGLGRGMQNGEIGEPPKRLDELLATFDESFVETSKIVGDGGGPHKSHPYGPGTLAIQRSVRINEDVNIKNEIIKKYAADLSSKGTPISIQIDGSQPDVPHLAEGVAGPPVFYPVEKTAEQLFPKTINESMQLQARGQSKINMKRSHKYKENSVNKHSEKSGGGALPVPVCLPVCCAAPCVIL